MQSHTSEMQSHTSEIQSQLDICFMGIHHTNVFLLIFITLIIENIKVFIIV